MRTGHQNSTDINSVRLCLHVPISGIQMGQGYKVRSLLPHLRSWESDRWRCTWTASSRQISPMIQRYIPINVQRSVSNSSEDWVMGVSLAWVLLPVHFRASFRRRGRRRRNNLISEERNGWERRASGRWPRLAGGKTRAVVMPSSDGHGAFASAVLGKGLSFYGRCGAATVI
jgi:hypothetical protein